MPDYAVYGGCLRSELIFPELREIHQSVPTWTLHLAPAPAPFEGARQLGEQQLLPDVYVRSFLSDRGFRLDFDDTATFDIVDGARTIYLSPKPGCNYDYVRADTLARVLGMAHHAAGRICLHGSAVAFGSRAGIAFLAPKLHGKSTLATSLTMAGALLMTDDNVVASFGSQPLLWPGVHRVRLWDDSARHVGGGEARGTQGSDTKFVLDNLPEDRLMQSPVPLAAVYVLMPPRAGVEDVVRRMPLPPVAAAMSILQHTRLGALLGPSGSKVLLDRAVTLAQHVPVYSLDFVRDYGQLEQVVARIQGWHDEAAAPRAVAGALP